MKNNVAAILIVGFLLVVMAITNPSMSDYKGMVSEKLWKRSIQLDEVGMYVDLSLERDDYIFFSVYKTEDGYRTIGVFNNFFT